MADESSLAETEKSPIPGLPADWAQQGTNKVIDLVDQVRAKTTGPAIGISRKVVYGLVAAILGVFLLPLLFIGVIRFAASWVDVWIVYLVLGILLIAGGFILWGKRPKGIAHGKTA